MNPTTSTPATDHGRQYTIAPFGGYTSSMNRTWPELFTLAIDAGLKHYITDVIRDHEHINRFGAGTYVWVIKPRSTHICREEDLALPVRHNVILAALQPASDPALAAYLLEFDRMGNMRRPVRLSIDDVRRQCVTEEE